MADIARQYTRYTQFEKGLLLPTLPSLVQRPRVANVLRRIL